MKMKLLFSVVFACALLTTSYAQINKGAIWLGSNFTYYESKDRPNQQTVDMEIKSTSILPAVGVVIKENLVAGIFGKYTNYRKINDGYFKDDKKKIYGGGVFVRRYVPVFNRFYMYGEGRLGYTHFKSETLYADGTQTSTSKPRGWATTLSFAPGISYGITKNIQVEAGVTSLFEASYEVTKYSYEPYTYSGKQKSFTAGVNLENFTAFTVGVRFLINKKA